MAQIINNPAVPFVGPVKGGLDAGTMIRIVGEVPNNADKFNINLHCGRPPSDIALHVSVRLLQGYIARNSLRDEDWGDEEGDGNLTIALGQPFEVLILCDPSSYKIAVNGQHFCEFRHRIPFNGVSHLEIDGTVQLKLIAFESVPPPPPIRPPQNMTEFSTVDVPPPPGPFGQGPPQRDHYGQGPPQLDTYGRAPGHYPRGPGQEGSGFESFLGQAGTAIAGAMISGLAENFLGNLSGGGQSHHPQRTHSPMVQPLQPQYQGGPQQHGQQSSIVEDLLGSLASEIFKPSRKN